MSTVPVGARWALFALVLLCPLRLSAQTTDGSGRRPRTLYEDLQMLTGVLNQIRVNHPDSVESNALILAAIRGMVSAADPHSYVIPYQPLAPERERLWREGKLHPVGISFMYVGGAPVVVAVSPGSGAARADIVPGDELLSIDGAPVRAQSAEELDLSLAGRNGSSVKLVFRRQRSDGSLLDLERDVPRDRPSGESAVPASFLLDSATGYVRVTTFGDAKVAEDLHSALESLERAGMKRLVLDLRDNGGGSVSEAASVAGEFLRRGAIVYTSEGRKKEVTDTGRVGRVLWSRERRYPVVVLVNEGTASASELVAGALQDHDRALIVGRPTFGKSLLMQPFPLPDGSVLVMVMGHVKTPCGRIIQRQYRDVSAREYYRRAYAERDTTGRPSCRTAAGRQVFGGGGIYPDVVLSRPAPRAPWVERAVTALLPLKWVGAWMQEHAPTLGSLEVFVGQARVPASAIADFRRFAQREGLELPTGDEADNSLQRLLTPLVAEARWGESGRLRLLALHDAEVRAARDAFGQASQLRR